MKTKLYLPIISLLAMSVFAFISCDDSDSDTTKPVIELSEPEEGQELKIGDEHGVHFEMDLSDDVMLKSYMIEIHIISTNIRMERAGLPLRAKPLSISVSTGLMISPKENGAYPSPRYCNSGQCYSGDYHLMVYCTDAAGNETYIARNIVLSTTAERDDHHHDE